MKEALSTHQFECAGVPLAEPDITRPVTNTETLKINTVSVIVTTFRDGVARVSCPHFDKGNGQCAAGNLTAACPYNHQSEKGVVDGTLSIEKMDLSVRARNCLRGAGIITADQIAERTAEELLVIKNFSNSVLGEVREKLARMCGLKLKGE